MECPKCKSNEMQVEQYRTEVLIYKNPDDYESVEEFNYSNSHFGDSIFTVYCVDCGSSFMYEFEDGIGEEIDLNKLVR